MLHGNLAEIGSFLPRHVLAKIKEFLGLAKAPLSLGRQVLIPDLLLANVSTDPLQVGEQPGESHQQFLDIHYVGGSAQTDDTSWGEVIRFAFPEDCTLQTPYNALQDVTQWQMHRAQEIILRPPAVLIFFPGEIHAASIAAPGLKRECKIVFKLRWPGPTSLLA